MNLKSAVETIGTLRLPRGAALRVNGFASNGRWHGNIPFVLRPSKHERANGDVNAVLRMKKAALERAPQFSQKPSAKLPSGVISQIPSGKFPEPFTLSCSHGELR